MFPSVLLSTAIFTRWAIIAHHVTHGGFDNCTPAGSRYKRFKFAMGSVFRRLTDWPDWILPEAWDYEHNHLHHYELNEDGDPDLVERNVRFLRGLNVPMAAKYVFVAVLMCTWRWSYYAPNTFAMLEAKKAQKKIPKEVAAVTILHMLMPGWKRPAYLSPIKYFRTVALPFLVYQGLLLSLFVVPVAGWHAQAYRNAVLNLILADILSNIHSFICIVTNHAGQDMYRYRTHCAPNSAAFYVRAIVSSANFTAGTDCLDFLHGFLSYQAEHHCFPRLSMLSLQKAMPRVKALAVREQVQRSFCCCCCCCFKLGAWCLFLFLWVHFKRTAHTHPTRRYAYLISFCN